MREFLLISLLWLAGVRTELAPDNYEYFLTGTEVSYPTEIRLSEGNFVPKVRYKRDAQSDDGININETADTDYATEQDKGNGTDSQIKAFQERVYNHKYYVYTVYSSNETLLNDRWFNVTDLLANKSISGNTSHPQLTNSYRRAVGHQLSFKFPFYGHLTSNITIATGGFLYVGEHTHSWLAATQYIAPLMANFDTTINQDSRIRFADTGELFVIEWYNVLLRNQDNAGSFSFQAVLFKNGDIWFLYKSVPISIKNVSDVHHPRKVGLSDAYLIMHHFYTLSRRVIYEYHRIDIDIERITNFTVIEIKAQPVCITISTCEECVSTRTESFNCSWCSGPSGDKGSMFCSDDVGLHRRRQEWLDNNCDTQAGNVYCPSAKSETPEASKSSSTAGTNGQTGLTDAPNGSAETGSTMSAHKSEISKQAINVNNGWSAGGVVSLIFILILVAITAWVGYAYYNPHTPSGQFLIRYRPSRWRWPGDHGDVRYTASVHM